MISGLPGCQAARIWTARTLHLIKKEDNEWIEEGAHLMIIAPAKLLDAFPTDPENGGPYVMWKGTPYAHLMVPVGPRDE